MYAHELYENPKPRVVVTYPGRFQPFHQGHAGVFAQLQKKFGNENVFIATSNDTSSAKSPFNYSDKYQLMTAAGVPGNHIFETNAMYSLPSDFNTATTVFITAVGAPDADRLNPDSYLKRDKKDKEGNVIKPAGSPGYYKTWDPSQPPVTADQHGYVIVIPEIHKSITINKQKYDVSHGTECRNLWNMIRDDDQARTEFLRQLYGRPDKHLAVIFDKIPAATQEDIDQRNTDTISPIHGGVKKGTVGLVPIEEVRIIDPGLVDVYFNPNKDSKYARVVAREISSNSAGLLIKKVAEKYNKNPEDFFTIVSGEKPAADRIKKPSRFTENENPANTLYFFDVASGGKSFSHIDLKVMGLRQTMSGKWYYQPGRDSSDLLLSATLKHLEKTLNVPARAWKKPVAEGSSNSPQTVTRIDSQQIKDFGSNLKAYKHTDDWSQSGIDTGDDSYWKNKNFKTNTTKGLFAGDPHRTALYATGNAYETRYVEFAKDGQPIVYFDKKDLPKMRGRKTYLTVFDAANFKKLPTGEYFSDKPGTPLKQTEIGDPFQYIANQGWIVRITDDLDKVFKQVQNMHKAGKIAHYGAEGMNESKQGVAEDAAGVGVVATNKKMVRDPRYSMSITQDVKPSTPKSQLRAFRLSEKYAQQYVQENINPEDFHVENTDKLDVILFYLCRMVVEGQKLNQKLFGVVAACVLDNDNRAVFGINYFNDATDNRVHAERCALDQYRSQYGEPPAGSIVITTCSPCCHPMEERYGESCTELINDTDIHKVYCGYKDPSQQEDMNRTFHIKQTRNADIIELCKSFADTFLKEGDLDEVFGFQTASPVVKKPKATLAQMRKEFDKEPQTPIPNVQQNKDASEKTAQEVHRKYTDEGVAEGLTEARGSLFAFVKRHFPTWPDYVLKDFLYPQAKGIRDQAELDDFLKRNKQDFGNCKWTLTKLPITFDIFTPKTQRMLASREGGSSNPFQVPRDAERHALQSQMIQQKGVSAEPIIVAKLSNGYDLIEGWHRTIQHLKAFPQGYTGPAWVCTGATYKSESVEQGVAEGKVKLFTDPSYFGAEIDDTGFDNLPVVNISVDRLVGFEPDDKMNQSKSKANVEKIVAGLKQGAKLPPLLVRKYKDGYQVLDGHHRFWAYKLLGTKSIPSRIVPDKDIEEISKQGVAEGFSNDMSTEDMIAYLRQHHDTNLHQDYLNHINTFSKFVLQNVPVNSIKTDLPKLDREKVEQYKQMDFSKAPPIVMGSGYILDGYHRANVAKALGLTTIKAYVGVQGQQDVSEGSNKSEATRRIQKMLNRKYNANLDVDGEMGPLTLKSINKFLPNAKIELADDPNKTTAVQGNKIKENFADGRHPEDKGDSKRLGVPTKASVSTLRKVAKQGGRKGQLAHWMANMKAGRAKANENVVASASMNEPDLPAILAKFLPIAMKDLGISVLPRINLEKHIESHDGQATFGRFVNDEESIHLAIADRHPVDILRTLAHELTHFKQYLNNQLKHNSGRTGSPEENEAHVMAGIIMRHFDKEYPDSMKLNPLNMG